MPQIKPQIKQEAYKVQLKTLPLIGTVFSTIFGTIVLMDPLAAQAAGQSQSTVNSEQENCLNLKNVKLSDAAIDSAEIVQGIFTPASKNADALGGAKSGSVSGLPKFCRVSLTIKPAIKIEVWLPVSTWNHRFQAVGGGGYAGFISYDALGDAIRQGYASASTDTGHSGSQLDGKFVLNKDYSINQQQVKDFSWRAVHEMTLKSKALISAYYQQPAKYSYWNGCSTGGRQGLMEAQRFPHDFNGIFVGAPAINWDRFIVAELWPKLVMQRELGGSISEDKLRKVNEAVIAKYDADDGVKDGVIRNPLKIKIDDSVLMSAGLNAHEIKVIRKIWAGPQSTDGKSLWYGIEPGAPFYLASHAFPISTDYIGSWLQQNPNWDWKNLSYKDYDKLLAQSEKQYGPIIATDNPNLSAFKNAGGKLIIWHGWSDQLIFPRGTIHYYKNVVGKMGGLSQTETFARLYMAPGVEHCHGGAGPDTIQGLNALVPWVEQGKAPNQVIADKLNNNQLVNSRPLCAWPTQAIYKGNGSPDDAKNFSCK